MHDLLGAQDDGQLLRLLGQWDVVFKSPILLKRNLLVSDSYAGV
jgi:hypothetical protein